VSRRVAATAWVLGLLAAGTAALAEEAGRIEWRREVMEAWQSARTSKKPLLIYVSLESCGHCRRMERETLVDPGVASRVGQAFVAARIDGEKDASLVKRLGVRIYPTTVIISPDNKVLDAVAGYIDADGLRARLDGCVPPKVAGAAATGADKAKGSSR